MYRCNVIEFAINSRGELGLHDIILKSKYLFLSAKFIFFSSFITSRQTDMVFYMKGSRKITLENFPFETVGRT